VSQLKKAHPEYRFDIILHKSHLWNIEFANSEELLVRADMPVLSYLPHQQVGILDLWDTC